MKVTIIPIVIGAFVTVSKGLFKELEDSEVGGRVETIQTTALQRTTRILRRVLVKEHYRERPEYWEESGKRRSANADLKNSNE